MQFIKQRWSVAAELFTPAWKWLTVVPFAVLSAVQAVRDEILPTDVAERYRLLQWLPDIDWRYYALVVLGGVIALLFEGSYRAVKKRDRQCTALAQEFTNQAQATDAYMHGAVALAPITNWDHQGGRKCSLQCALEIVPIVPIQYYVSRFEATYEGKQCPPMAEETRTGIAGPNDTRIIELPFVDDIPWNKNKRWTGTAKYTFHYGLMIDNGGFPYRIDREVTLSVNEGQTTQYFAIDMRSKT